MKFISTIGFLFLFVARAYLSSKAQQFSLDPLTDIRHNRFVKFVTSYAVFLIPFVQFWLLTRIFPLALIAVLIGASWVGFGISSLIGAVAGIAVREKREKISALAIICTMQQTALGCSILSVALVAESISLIGSLWVFWSHPLRDPHALVWIAIFLFLLPKAVGLTVSIVTLWGTIASEYVDDDLRNSYLSGSFSAIITDTLGLVFPVWIVRSYIPQVFGGSFPHFWVFLSVPLLAFLAGKLLPFFIGVYRFRAQERIMLHWQQTWLKDVYELLQLPSGRARDQALREQEERLDQEIQRRFSQDPIFAFYESLVREEITEEQAAPTSGGNSETVGAEQSDLSVVAEGEPTHNKTIVDIRKVLHGAIHPKQKADNIYQQVQFVVKKYKSHMVDWDIRFGYLSSLLQLREVMLVAQTNNVSDFFKARLEGIKATTEKQTSPRNVLAASITGVLSSLIVFLFKSYHTEVFDLISTLVKQ